MSAPRDLVELGLPPDMVDAAWAAYESDVIDAGEFAAAIDHIAAGGRGCEEFPYLPVFEAPAMQRVWW